MVNLSTSSFYNPYKKTFRNNFVLNSLLDRYLLTNFRVNARKGELKFQITGCIPAIHLNFQLYNIAQLNFECY